MRFTDPERSTSGLYVVGWKDNFVAWYAWREWLRAVFGKRFFPAFQTTVFAWPPTTETGAQMVARQLREWREQVEKERKRGELTRGRVLKAIPESAAPWNEWAPQLQHRIGALEAKRRHEWENEVFELSPKYPWMAAHWGGSEPPMKALPSHFAVTSGAAAEEVRRALMREPAA